jgi:hypothetical protein
VHAGSGLDPGTDVLVAHVRDAFTVPDRPNWTRDVRPILAPYSALYPIMGRHLADLGDRDEVAMMREAMLLALTRAETDPNHMPVTRDLSGPKRATIVRWLEQLEPPARRVARVRPQPPGTAVPLARDAKAALADAVTRRTAGPGAN